ncbi:MAG: nickel pincer cofactor biosynthesis protein LarC [Anaerolineae bacterium]
MKIPYFDCIGSASGDMILGALLDAGLPEETLRERLAALHLKDFGLTVRRVNKNGFSATKVDVIVADDVPERHLAEIEAIIAASDLAANIQRQAVAIFRRLAEVEAGIHGTTLDHVHLHELGGVDTIVDVVGCLVGLDALGIERVYASPLPLGRGFIKGAHGQIPLPAPATVALLKGVPVVGSDIEKELVTPTGAALLAALAAGFGPIPPMTLAGVGYGAGGRDLPVPNLIRLLIGDQETPAHLGVESVVVLETNIDDLNPQVYDYVMARLFKAGALDVFLEPIQMKKNRPGTLLRVICRPGDTGPLADILLAETSTLGVRQQVMSRVSLRREVRTVETPYGAVRVKIATLRDGARRAAAEYDDCRRLAEETGAPLREIQRAAERAADESFMLRS